MSLFRKLLGSTSLTAAAPSAGKEASNGGEQPGGGAAAPAAELSEERIEAALQAARAEGREEGIAVGAQQERERTSAVFASDEGKANMSMAAWMLGNNPGATADAIAAQLKTLPAQAATPTPTPTATLTTPLAETPQAELNGKKPADAATDGAASGENSDKMWEEVQAAGRDRFVGSLAGAAPAIAQGGNALPTRTGF